MVKIKLKIVTSVWIGTLAGWTCVGTGMCPRVMGIAWLVWWYCGKRLSGEERTKSISGEERMTKKTRKKKTKRPLNKCKKALNALAWQFAHVMNKLPPRKGQGDMIIDHLGKVGCIPIGGSQSDYFWCSGCFNEGICNREGSGKFVKWRLLQNNTLAEVNYERLRN